MKIQRLISQNVYIKKLQLFHIYTALVLSHSCWNITFTLLFYRSA